MKKSLLAIAVLATFASVAQALPWNPDEPNIREEGGKGPISRAWSAVWEPFNETLYSPSLARSIAKNPNKEKFYGATAGVVGIGAIAGSLPVAALAVPVVYYGMVVPPASSGERTSNPDLYALMEKNVSDSTIEEQRALELAFSKMQDKCNESGGVAGGKLPHLNFIDWSWAAQEFESGADKYERDNKIKSGGVYGGNVAYNGEFLSRRAFFEKKTFADVYSPKGRHYVVNHKMIFDYQYSTLASPANKMEMKFQCDRGTFIGANIGGQDTKMENKFTVSLFVPKLAKPENLTVKVVEWDGPSKSFEVNYMPFTADDIAIIKGQTVGKKVNMD